MVTIAPPETAEATRQTIEGLLKVFATTASDILDLRDHYVKQAGHKWEEQYQGDLHSRDGMLLALMELITREQVGSDFWKGANEVTEKV